MTAIIHQLRTEASEGAVDFTEEVRLAQEWIEIVARYNNKKWKFYKATSDFLNAAYEYAPEVLIVYLRNIGYTELQANFILRHIEPAYVIMVIAYNDVDGLTKTLLNR